MSVHDSTVDMSIPNLFSETVVEPVVPGEFDQDVQEQRTRKFTAKRLKYTLGVKWDRLAKLFHRLERSMKIIVDQMDCDRDEDQIYKVIENGFRSMVNYWR